MHAFTSSRRRLLGAAVLAAGLGTRGSASAAAACGLSEAQAAAERDAIVQVIARMEAAWNRGDFRGYMAGFLNPGVVFVSKGRFQNGWQGTLDHYIRDYGGAPGSSGVLRFSEIKVEMLAPDAAQLISRYELKQPTAHQRGINTRLMRKVGGQWCIALNHVSAEEEPR
jgi:uncharacterized protein (TIGR02246 family)